MHRFGADLRWVFPGGPEVEPLPDGGWRDPCGFILSPAGAFNTFCRRVGTIIGPISASGVPAVDEQHATGHVARCV